MRTESTDIETAHDVKLLVGHFYTRIREDAVLGTIFDDIAQVDWVDHIPTMCEFWETVLFRRPGYKGNPIQPHVALDQLMKQQHQMSLRPSDFDRWVDLFHSTVDKLFVGDRAEQAKRGATRMAEQMVLAIERGDASSNSSRSPGRLYQLEKRV